MNNQSISLPLPGGSAASGRSRRRTAVASIYAAFGVVLALFTFSASAQSRSLRQFQHTAWSLQSGAPSQIMALAQTSDGFLWMGTVNGLFRFDGVTFEAYRPPNGQQFPHTSIQCLTATSDGGLWIGYTLGDTAFLKNGVVTARAFHGKVKLGGGTVYNILIRRDGSTWAATNDGAVRFVSGEWQDAEPDSPARVKLSTSVAEDNGGTLWMATQDYVYRLPPGAQNFQKTSIKGDEGAIFSQAQDGSFWIAEPRGIYPVADSHGALISARNFIPAENTVNDFFFDKQGSLWITGSHSGVTRVEHPDEVLGLPRAAQQQRIEHIAAANGLTSDMAFTLL